MFEVGFAEMAVVGVIALLVVGPKDLPKLMRTVGHWTGRARGMARHVRSGFDTMVREAEIEELNKRWDEQNREIMAATRVDSWSDADSPLPGLPAPAPSVVNPATAMTPIELPAAEPKAVAAASPPPAGKLA